MGCREAGRGALAEPALDQLALSAAAAAPSVEALPPAPCCMAEQRSNARVVLTTCGPRTCISVEYQLIPGAARSFFISEASQQAPYL